MKKNIIFICNGNIHRSVIAEKSLIKILQENGLDNKFSVASYGLQGTKGTAKPLRRNLKEYPKEYKAALPTLRKFKIDIDNHSFQRVTLNVIKKASLVIAMDEKVYLEAENSLLKQFSELKHKIHIFSELTKNHEDIKDPFGNTDFKLHQSIIKNIYFTMKNKINTILDWTNNND